MLKVGESSAGFINQSLQLRVCEQILGGSALSSQPESSPFWTVMVYRTFIHEDKISTGQKSRRLLISTSSFGQCRPSTSSGRP